MADPKVVIYYGPASGLKTALGKKSSQEFDGILEIAHEQDAQSRRVTVVSGPRQDGQPEPDPAEAVKPRHSRVLAASSDYASLNEHVISNFAGFVRGIGAKKIVLHNPPAHVHRQLTRTFEDVRVESFRYPHISLDALRQIGAGFKDRIVGQERALDRLLAALYPLTAQGRSKPVVLMFCGPSGVGKTETAKFVNGVLGGTLMRRQFSMFHSDKFASYLFGGHHSETSFAHDLLDRESSVIVLDEFDKANQVFHGAFYQLFDEGVFEDKNYEVTVGPAVIICTSNYRSEEDVRVNLGDPLHSRFDAVIEFNALTTAAVMAVIDRLTQARYDALTPDEQARVALEGVRSLLRAHARKLTNVRRIGKMVDEMMSIILVRAAFEHTTDGVSMAPSEG
ncbi:MAG: AAA family ATPase [Bifidobacteriaceae bacterium]|nr:AAA family ATPase [Bifidobacteriaceae bacterium]